MTSFCGLVDFSAKTSDVSSLIAMWRSLAPLGRGFLSLNGGVSLICERAPHLSASHPLLMGGSISVVLGAECEGVFAEDLLLVYENEGLASLCAFGEKTCFALADQKEKLLVISAQSEPIFIAEKDSKIIFAPKKEALSLICEELPYSASKIAPYGFALYSKT